MMKNRTFQRFLSMLLMVLMVLATAAPSIGAIEIGTGSESTFQSALQAATQAETEKTPIDAAIFFSDLHIYGNDTNYASKGGTLQAIMQNMSGVADFSSVTSCGDVFAVNNDTDGSAQGKFTGYLDKVSGYIKNVFPNMPTESINYVWSDHDRYAVWGEGSNTTALEKESRFVYGWGEDGILGTDDDDNYYIYLLTTYDMATKERYNVPVTAESEVTARIEEFSALAETLKSDRPLFIASHMPLIDNRNDNGYAYKWCTAINEVAEDQDVAFFFGHNHAYETADMYFTERGSTMSVCSSASGSAKSVTLNFDHVCVGFMSPTSKNTNASLTRQNVALAVLIYEDEIKYVTYDKSGLDDSTYATNETVTRKVTQSVNPDDSDDSETDTPVTNEPIVDANTNISVKAENASGLTVSVVTDEKYSNAVSDIFSGSVVMYDIKLESFTGEASVTMPIPAGMDASKFCVYHVAEDGTTEPMAGKPAADGMTYTFTTNHFSVFVGGVKKDVSIGGEVVEASGSIQETTTAEPTYQLASSIISDRKYLIASGWDDNVYFMSNTGGISRSTSVNSIANLSNLNNYLWTIESAINGYTIKDQNGGYMYPNATRSSGSWTYSISSQQTSSQNVKITFNENVASISREVSSSNRNTSSYLTFVSGNYYGSNSKFSAASSVGNGLYLWEQVPGATTTTTTPVTIKLQKSTTLSDGETQGLAYEITLGNGEAVTTAGITWSTSDSKIVTVNNGVLTAVSAGEATITATLNSVNGKALSTPITVTPTVTVAGVQDVEVTSKNITVNAGTSLDTNKISVLITYTAGNPKTIQLPLSALKDENGNTVSTTVKDTTVYENLSLTYEGRNFTGIKLTVTVDNFPQYPLPGSVNLNKTAIGIDFQNTGVTRVELSASGLPAKKGVDVVVVIDTSSSMRYNAAGTQVGYDNANSRYQIMKRSLQQMLTTFRTPNATTGVVPDIDIAIIDFNGYGSSNYIDNASLDDQYRTDADNSKVYTVDGNAQLITGLSGGLTADHFMKNTEIDPATMAAKFTSGQSGTNYDVAFQNAYDLLEAKKAANAAAGDSREQYVIFLSDGASFRYNGFMTGNSGNRTRFDQWLDGIWANADALKTYISANNYHSAAANLAYLYNGNGTTHPHRMAEAIKGDPDQVYDVVLNTSAKNTDGTYLYQRNGLGAKIYSIGFCMQDDTSNGTTVQQETLLEVIKTLSSGEGYYVENVTDEDQLSSAFNQIASEIAIAATNARFVDQLGDSFELQMNPVIITNQQGSGGETTINTDITVRTRPIYTASDVGLTKDDGTKVTSDDIGKPYGDGTTYETVKFTEFNSDGTIKTVTSTAKDGNILVDDVDGVICAKYFFYNTTKSTQTITLENGSTYELPPETFYWNIGTINEQQFTLTYYVYLTGALDGDGVPSGGYGTNNFAILTYDNYLGNEVSMSVASPTIAWKGAQVSYAFYLVDQQGNPLYKDGSTAPNFYTAYKVTQPVVYSTIELNENSGTVLVGDILGQNVLPEGYALYAPDVSYSVSVGSGDADRHFSSWTITNGLDATYVTGFGAADDYSKAVHATTDSSAGDAYHNSYDYTNTTVWFPVVWIPTTIPDKVVIDYGLPLYITIMQNDQFGANAKLLGIETIEKALAIINDKNQGEETATADNLNKFNFDTKLYADKSTPTSLNLAYGSAVIEGDKILYTPKSTSMNGYDQFAYEVLYETGKKVPQYYYGTVTVIPATTVYYEDNFAKGEQNGITYTGTWEVIDNTDSKQDEDRPGQFSLQDIDKNNLYGYDASYKGMASYSMNGYHKATVTSGQFASVTFNFVGTGFDIISMTGGQTGGILVDIVNPETNAIVKSLMVDTYYGYTYGMSKVTYTYTNGKWEETSVVLASAGTSQEKPTKPTDGATYTVYENRWVQTDEGELYQVPVIKASGLEYGAYRAEIYVFYDELFAAKNTQEFYLDAIRIYNPAGDTYGNSGNIDDVIQDAHFADGEAWPVYHELRNLVLDSGSIGSNYASGLVFIDGYGETADISNYRNFGPNNELYLAPGQSISGKLNCTDANVEKIQIALKTVGGTGSVKIYDANLVDNADEVAARTIDSATDLYYEITALNGKNIVIHNSSAEDSGVIISITNIKVTHEAEPAASGSTTFAEEPATSLFLVNDESAARALFTLRAPIQPDLFEPDHFGIRIPAPTVKLGQKVTVIITTSKDVEALMVNGKLVSKYTGNKKSLFRTWSVQIRAEEVGDLKVSVSALDSNGLESASISDTVTVVAKQNKK